MKSVQNYKKIKIVILKYLMSFALETEVNTLKMKFDIKL